ncbi:MAG: hypothetical protein DMG12_04725 [Acidobacteria bacterium]|nr:MAG: hypothetical protein DMG12_04725 [Acidobacteriota bacterium]
MIKTVEAIIDGDGNIRLLEPVDVKLCRRALLVILDEPGIPSNETALLSEEALRDWSRPEEDAAWSHLQPAK